MRGKADPRRMTPVVPDVITYDTVAAAIGRAIILTDPDGLILRWNLEAEQLYGWRAHEAIGQNIVKILAPPAAHQEYRTLFERSRSGELWENDRMVVRRDGSKVRVHSSGRPIYDAMGVVVAVVGVSIDATEQRVVEQRERQLTEHLRLALDAGGLGTWRWNMHTGATLWDEQLERLFGLDPGEFDGTFETYVSLIHHDDREGILRTAREAIETGSSYQVEHRVVWPDNTVHWVGAGGAITRDADGEIDGTIGCISDVTERIEHEEERQRVALAAAAGAERERLQRQRLEFLGTINEELNASTSVDDIMRRVTAASVPHLGSWCSGHLFPAEGTGAVVADAHLDAAMAALAGQLRTDFPDVPDAAIGFPAVARTGRTELNQDIDEALLQRLYPIPEQRAIAERLGVRSSITVAIKKRDRVLGVMQFVSSATSRPYTLDDVSLAEAVASRIGASIENRRLNEQRGRIARTLQASLLPVTLPDIPGTEIAVMYWAAGEATEVGGDFYDVFLIEPSLWAIVIGDVCGTGPDAAALTGLARHSIRDAAWHGDAPAEVLRSLNRAILRSDAQTFCTATYATVRWTGATLELTVARAGHPGPIHLDDRGPHLLGEPGTLLGLFETTRSTTTTTVLHPGDAVVFYTDGATDLPPPHDLTDRELGLAAFQMRGRSAEATANGLHDILEDILPFAQRTDDLALLVLTVPGREPGEPGR